jgi:acetyltransferase-like isoleucine patch superfamily enzyme
MLIISPLARLLNRILMKEYSVWGDSSRLTIAKTAVVTNTLFNLSSGRIVIEDYVMIAHNVSLLTGTHDYRKKGLERNTSIPKEGGDIIIKKGVWIASNVTIIGPCTIGENSVIGAGCLIHKYIPANTLCRSTDSVILTPID